MRLPPGIAKVLVTESEIQSRVARLAEEILASVDENAESVLLLSVLSGYVCVCVFVWKGRETECVWVFFRMTAAHHVCAVDGALERGGCDGVYEYVRT